MYLTGRRVSRRAMLRGVGATVALPWLEAMVPASAGARAARAARAATRVPPRLVCIEMVHGAAGSSAFGRRESLWAPKATGTTFDLAPTSLASLEPFRDALTIVSGTDVPSADPTEAREIGGDHFRSSATFLTQSYPHRTEGADVRAGISLDQLYAQRVGQSTPLPSMQLCIESTDQGGGCEYGYSCVYSDTISWASPTRPVPMTRDPRVVFDQMYGTTPTGDPVVDRQRRREDASLLDTIRTSAARLARTLGPGDRVRLDDYLESVREIERRIQVVEARNTDGEPREIPGAPAAAPDSYTDHVRLMADLFVQALRADITRVVAFKMSRDGSNRVFPESGVKAAFHILSHHGEDPARVRALAAVNAYHVRLVGEILGRLRDVGDGDGTLLDQTLVLYGSPMGNPNHHNHKHVPFLLAGRAGGTIPGGRHLAAPPGTPLSNVMLSVLHALGLDDVTSFGDSEGAFALS
jgi:Protein of unknown function (DUF1552)